MSLYSDEQIEQIVEQAEYILEDISEEMKKKQTTFRKSLNNFIYTDKMKETDQEVEVIELADLIELLKQKYPEIMEEDVDFIFEYVFENRNL